MKAIHTLAAAIGILAATALLSPGSAVAASRDIVLVHGMNMDGSAWRPVYDRLTADGLDVTIVQLPMTSIQDDITAVRRAVKAQDGAVVLVGHSYGGMVISQAGVEPAVKALVYVAAFQPEIGESLGALNASIPSDLPPDAIRVSEDGYFTVKAEAWIADVANGLPEAEARRTAAFQSPVNASIFGYGAEYAAWRDVLSWAAIATNDRTIAPALQRKMASRAKSTVVEIDGGHLLPLSHPAEIASLIEQAADAVK